MKLDENLLWTERLWTFVAEIRASPDDPAPRLVFADWLSDHGQEEFAQDLRDECDPDSSWQTGLWPQSLHILGIPAFPRPSNEDVEPSSKPMPAGPSSQQMILHRVRPPRVQITYWKHGIGAMPTAELPFVIGVIADLSGNARQQTLPLGERGFQPIDRDNFNWILRTVAPRISIRIPSRLPGTGSESNLELDFAHIDDFEPERIIARLPQLSQPHQTLTALYRAREVAELLESSGEHDRARPRPRAPNQAPLEGEDSILDLAQSRDPVSPENSEQEWPDEVRQLLFASSPDELRLIAESIRERVEMLESALTAQVTDILHHPEFQQLEGTWRGLHYLVHQAVTGVVLVIEVLDVRKQELIEDFAEALERGPSFFFQKTHLERLGSSSTRDPFGLLVGDFEFGHSFEDTELIENIGADAMAANVPFIAGAAAEMFGLETLSQLSELPDPSALFEQEEYLRWRRFRQSEMSRFVGLTVPRVLARSPYTRDSKSVEAFEFDEQPRPDHEEDFVWMNAAWVFAERVADSYARHSWFGCIKGMGSRRGNPPMTLGANATLGPSRRTQELSQLGFLPLVRIDALEASVFLSANSCREAGNEESAVGLDALLCCTRFVPYLRPERLQDAVRADPDQWEKAFQEWLNDYVSNAAMPRGGTLEARKPLFEAKIEIREARLLPGRYEMVLEFRPRFQFDDPQPAARLMALLEP